MFNDMALSSFISAVLLCIPIMALILMLAVRLGTGKWWWEL